MLLSQYRALRKLQDKIELLTVTDTKEAKRELQRIERKQEYRAYMDWNFRETRRFKPKDNAVDSTGIELTVPYDQLKSMNLWLSLGYPKDTALFLVGDKSIAGGADALKESMSILKGISRRS